MKKHLLAAAILASTAATAVAQSPMTTESPEKDWNVNWTPYIWAANLEADVKLGPVNTTGTLDFSDIVDKMDAAFMHLLEFNKGRWGISNEIIYFDLSDSKTGPIANIVRADVGMKQSIIDLTGTYKATEDGNTTVLAGLRYIALDMDIKTTSGIPLLNQSISKKEDWTNLLVGVRQIFPINESWSLMAKGDIATDFSDEMSYILTVGANYTMTDLLDLKVGYRYAGVDYENSEFTFEETADGLFTGLTFKW